MRSKFFAFATAAATILLVGAGVYAQSQTTPDGQAEQASYENQQFNFSLNYPADMTVSEVRGDGGGETISFTDATSGRQFEIDVAPYSTVNLDGASSTSAPRAAAFDQGDTLSDVDVFPGDTVQILFTKNHVLYEIIGFKDDEPWLLSLLQTWRFH